MPRAPGENVIQAEKMFADGMSMVEIANKLDVSAGTVRSWKNRYGWGKTVKKNETDVANENVALQNQSATLQKGSATLQKGSATLRKEKSHRKTKNKALEREVHDVCENKHLTDKQRLFCLYYVRCFNATKAYQKAYGCSYATAGSNGYELLQNTAIKDEINRLKQNRMNRELLEEQDIFQKYMDIAFADITDYTVFGNKEIEVRNDETGQMEKITVSYVNIRDSGDVDGTIVSEVSKGKDGVKVKLADRMQALKWIADHMNLATEEQRARIDALKSKNGSGENTDAVDDWISAVLGEDADGSK